MSRSLSKLSLPTREVGISTRSGATCRQKRRKSLPTREVGISTVRIFKGRGHLASHFPHGKWGFQHGGPSWGQVQPCHFPHGKWGFQLDGRVWRPDPCGVTSHTGSGDFNCYLTSTIRSIQTSLPTREVGISTLRKRRPDQQEGSLPTREVGISTVPPFAPPA